MERFHTKTFEAVLNAVSVVNASSSLVLFLIGFFYLTIKANTFEFNCFSITMMAAVFLTFGLLSILINIYAIVVARSENFGILLTCVMILYFFFFIILSLCLCGFITINSNEKFNQKIQANMLNSLKKYEEKSEWASNVQKINWLQTKFQCCGINSHDDWKSHLSSLHLIFKQISGNLSEYIDDVPDSCCKRQTKNCGKIYSEKKDETIYLNGCLQPFLQHSIRNLNILCTFGMAIGLIDLISIGVLAVAIFRLMVSNYTLISR